MTSTSDIMVYSSSLSEILTDRPGVPVSPLPPWSPGRPGNPSGP